MASILSLDDSKHFRMLIEGLLKEAGHEVTCIESWVELAATIRANRPDLLLLDLNMPLPGENLGAVIKRFYSDLPFLFVSGEPVERIERAVETMNACGYVRKDANFRRVLIQKVASTLARFKKA